MRLTESNLPLRLVSVEPIKPREACAQFFEREKTPTVFSSARESSLKVQHDLFLLVLEMKRGEGVPQGHWSN